MSDRKNEKIKKRNTANLLKESNSEEQETKQNKLAFVVAVVVIAILLLTGTFAWLRIGTTASKVNKIKAGTLDLRIDESPTSTENIIIEREIPKSYHQGLLNQPYKFTIQNYSSMATNYEITLVSEYNNSDEQTTKIPDNYIRYLLVKNDEEMYASNSKLLSTGRKIETSTIQGGSKSTPAEIPYTLYIWIDSKAGDQTNGTDIMNMIFNAKISVSAVQYHETTPVTKNVWISNDNNLCIKSGNDDLCFSPQDSYNKLKGELTAYFGESACSENQLGSATNLMYRCDTNRSNDYGTCYVQYYESQNRTVLACALEDAAKYNGMTGSKSCSIDNSGKGIYDAQGSRCMFYENGDKSSTPYKYNE